MWQACDTMAGHGPSAAQVLGRVTLVTGKEEYLSARTVSSVRHAIRAYDADAEIADSPGGDLTLAALDDMSSPSLFSSTRCVIVTSLEDASDEVADGLVEYAAAPVDEVALVLVHSGGAKGSGVLTRLRKLDAVTEVKSAEVKYARDFVSFVGAEFAVVGARSTPEAADFLVLAVGQDLRSLSAAVSQLTNDFPDQQIGIDEVKRYFGGRAEAKSFAVADHAFGGRPAPALEELRWALEGGTATVLVTSAFAAGARGIARYLGAARGLREADLARELGVPPWKVKTIRDQSRGWTDEGIGAAVQAVARADADIKGAAHDAAYTLERLVLTVSGLRSSR